MRRFKKMLVFVVIIVIVFALASVISAWTFVTPAYDITYAISDEGVTPGLVSGNDKPEDQPGFEYFKYDMPDGYTPVLSADGTELLVFNVDSTDASKLLKVWIGIDNGTTFVKHWETVNINIEYFIMKGGNNYFVYDYSGSKSADGSLYCPHNIGGQIAGISHMSIFYTSNSEETDATVEESTGPADETTSAQEETTAGEETTSTDPSDETISETSNPEETTSDVDMTDESIPLVSNSTDPSETTILEDEIPQTGETGLAVLVGIVLLALAASLAAIVYRRRSSRRSKQQ